jgi:hypothetical protein
MRSTCTVSLALILLSLHAGCGGQSMDGGAGQKGGDAGNSSDTGVSDSSSDTDNGSDGSSPIPFDAGVCGTGGTEFYVCGGTNDCFVDASPDVLTLTGCDKGCSSGNPNPEPGGAPGLCLDPSTIANAALDQCADGQIMFNILSYAWLGYPFSVGQALANSGANDEVLRYCDWEPWTGAPLPLPTTCPVFSTFNICGGACGTCNAGESCRGRSPEHPYGICLPSPLIHCLAQCGSDAGCVLLPCPSGMSCAQYIDSTSSGQELAVDKQFCVPSSSCAELGQYPGGAECVDAGTD